MFVILSYFMVTPVFAGFITETTQMQWNSKVIEKALNDAGFIGSDGANWDVRTTRNHILEDLLTRQMFSIKEAIDVCKEQCNKSDFLKNGRGQSGKKCPELCENFANNIIKVNQEQYTSIPSISATSNEFSKLQGKAVDVCRRLMSDATTSGISYPVLCGGRCDRLGQDKVQITDLVKTKEYDVDDFCNNDEKGRDYFYILSDAKGAIDVSSLYENQRIAKLKEIQTKPVSDYFANKEKNRIAPMKNQYSNEVEQNGYCYVAPLKLRGDCKRQARKLAQQCRCKVKGFTTYITYHYDTGVGRITGCHMGDPGYKDGNNYSYDYTPYEYTPTFEDCKATFDESTCGTSMKELWSEEDGYSSSDLCQSLYSD